MLTLGYKASAEQFGPRPLLDLAVLAEEHGFDSVFTSDHFQPWRHTDGHAPNCFAWLGAAAIATKQVILGTSVVTPTFRYNPAIVAQAMATVGCLAEGRRVILGVGTGESLNEVAVMKGTWPDQKERFARLREASELIRKLWAEEDVDFAGEFYETHWATIYDKPEIPVELWIAASGPAAARLAGRVADGFICTSGKGRELYVDTLLPAVQEGADKAGRDVAGVEKMIEMKVSFDTDRQRALEKTAIWAALALPAEDKLDVHDPRIMEALAEQLPLERAASRWLVSDDPDEHLEQIAPYIEMGFTHLVFHAPTDDQASFIELYGKEILPRLRARWG